MPDETATGEAERPPGAPEVDFFGIGAPKCATTWLTENLRAHPEITIARIGETAFFAPIQGIFEPKEGSNYLEWEWFADQFKDADEGDVLGDMSTQHIWNDETAPQDIRRFYPEARFVVMLRDPVDRAYAHYWGGRAGNPDAPETFREALEIEHFRRRNRYHSLLTSWFDVFDRDRFAIHLLEDVKEDPEAVVRETYEHVGVDPGFTPPSLEEKVRTTRRSHIRPLRTLAERFHQWGLGPVVDAVNAVGIGPMIKRVGTSEVEYPPMDPETGRWLRQELDDEIQALEDLLDRDLSHWRADGGE